MTATSETAPLLRPEMPELDTLRGIAILLVLLYHGMAWSVSGAAMTEGARRVTAIFLYGWSGIQLFFVLSGFLITGILIRSRTRQRYYRTFYLRRALRVLPAFLLMLVVLLASGTIGWRYALLSTAFLANLTPLFGVAMEYPPLWSLAVEEHFYLVWPAVVRGVAPGRLWLTVVALVAGGPLLRAWGLLHGQSEGLFYYSWFNVDGLALGALLAIVARRGRRSLRRAAGACSLTGLLIVGICLVLHTDITTRKTLAGAALQFTVLYLGYGAVLCATILAGTSRFRSLVTIAPLRWLGFLSYGLYLVHVACFILFDHISGVDKLRGAPYGVAFLTFRLLAGGGVSIVIAAASRRYYEAAFLSMKERVAPYSSAPHVPAAARTS